MVDHDLDRLLNALLPASRQYLRTAGGFCPFGAALTTEGAEVAFEAYRGGQEPQGRELLDRLVQQLVLNVRAARYRAIGICVDTRLVSSTGRHGGYAVLLSLEHASGAAKELYLPYRMGFLGRLTFGELRAGERRASGFIP